MNELKVTTDITYTYETSDGMKFIDDKEQALQWQKHLDVLENVPMLDHNFNPTKAASYVMYIKVDSQEQLDAFNFILNGIGCEAELKKIGYNRYDSETDDFISIDDEIKRLQHMVNKLDGKVDEQ